MEEVALKTVIFDMDGLMIDSERISYRILKQKVEIMGFSCDLEFYKQLLGVNEQRGIFLLKQYYGPNFTAIVCGDEIVHSKPAPDIFLKVLEKTETLPQEALILEDSEAGIQAAFSAGIPVICVPDMKEPAPEFAEKTLAVVSSLSEVSAWIKK